MGSTELSAFAYSVIVTTFRRADYLAETLEGIAAQTIRPAAVIVADDGSGEPHLTANRTLAESHGFTYLQLPHSGLPGVARDRALALVSTPWVALSDDDDIWDARHIERLSEQVHDGVVLVAGNARRSDSGTAYRETMPHSVNLVALFPRNPVITSAVLVRVSSLVEIGGFTPLPRGAEDYASWLRLATLGDIVIVNEPTVMYRVTPGSLSAQASKAKRPLPLLCAADFIIWSYGRQGTLGRMSNKALTLLLRPILLRVARAKRNAKPGTKESK